MVLDVQQLGASLLLARLTPALLHHHHSLLPALGSTLQKYRDGVGSGGGTAGAGALTAEGPHLSTQLSRLPLGWDKEGAALTEAQLVVDHHRLTSMCCHMLRGGCQHRGAL